ncbi:hypothetical protein ACERII_25615 [Evansella sp. AB-rgal1]|uniref:hypothetical protein n=1 Tax=Evansella sp. AB-rgal1 TaxID=3242696 RepID=UPI00359E364C
MLRELSALTVTTLTFVFFMLLHDFYNSKIEINNFFLYIFSFETVWLILIFGPLFFVTLIPIAYLIEHKLKIQTKRIQVLLFFLAGGFIFPIITLILEREVIFDFRLAIYIMVAASLFGAIRKLNINKYNSNKGHV